MAIKFAEDLTKDYNRIFLELTATQAFLEFQTKRQKASKDLMESPGQFVNPQQSENQQQMENHLNRGDAVIHTNSDESGESAKSDGALLATKPQVPSMVEKNLLDQTLILISKCI